MRGLPGARCDLWTTRDKSSRRPASSTVGVDKPCGRVHILRVSSSPQGGHMDLDTQAELAVAEVLAGSGVTLGAVELAVARVAWLEGYKAGADATRKIAREVMEQA